MTATAQLRAQIELLKEALRVERTRALNLERRIDRTCSNLKYPKKVCTGWYKGETVKNSNVQLLWLRERVIAGAQLGKITVVEVKSQDENDERLEFSFIDKPEIAP